MRVIDWLYKRVVSGRLNASVYVQGDQIGISHTELWPYSVKGGTYATCNLAFKSVVSALASLFHHAVES